MAITIREAKIIERKLTNGEYAAHIMEQIDQALIKLNVMEMQDLVENECYFNEIADDIKFLNEKIQLNKRIQNV